MLSVLDIHLAACMLLVISFAGNPLVVYLDEPSTVSSGGGWGTRMQSIAVVSSRDAPVLPHLDEPSLGSVDCSLLARRQVVAKV